MTDPLGRSITLSDETWFGHIVRGHPEIRAYRAEVETTVQRPARIFVSRSDPGCRLYYSDSPRPGLLICVVANVVSGVILTAYLTRRIKPGIAEWP